MMEEKQVYKADWPPESVTHEQLKKAWEGAKHAPIVIFARVARALITSGEACDVLAAANVIPADRYFEKLVMELAGQYSKNGEAWFRERYKEHI